MTNFAKCCNRDTVLPAGSDRNGPAFSKTAALRWMTIVLLVVFAFGANGLNTDPIWTDELYAISNMGGWDPPSSPAEIVSSVADNFPDHVPLFFLLGASWAHFVGWTQFALRLMPVLAGLLMIAWIYRLGSAMFSRFTGFVAALLLGTSAFIILYIHDFRMYSMFLMFAAMHFWLYWRLAHNRSVSRLTLPCLWHRQLRFSTRTFFRLSFSRDSAYIIWRSCPNLCVGYSWSRAGGARL